MNFKNIQELHETFVRGQFEVSSEFAVQHDSDSERLDVFECRESSPLAWSDIINGSKNPMVIYETGLGVDREWIGFCWTLHEGKVIPADVQRLPVSEVSMTEALNVIGDVVSVRLSGFRGIEIKAKVDTGATLCSLHAEGVKVEGESVRFTCPAISPNPITMPLAGQQAVKTAGNGAQYRPMIELDVVIGDVNMRIQFNLNDRSNMEFPILLGQNALEKGKFLIDPSMQEAQINWDDVQANFVLTETIVENVNTSTHEELFVAIEAHARAASDLVRQLRLEQVNGNS